MRERALLRYFGGIVLLLAGLGMAPPVAADQAAYISREQAEQAALLIEDRSEIRHFAPPAGDTQWRAERVERKEVRHTGFENYYEVRVNGTPIDLAYVYIPQNGAWVNLAMAIGLEAIDVPRYLPEAGRHFSGAIGFDPPHKFYMTLTRDGDKLLGTYHYLSKGIPIDLAGTIEDDGRFTLEESVEGKTTGRFEGRLLQGPYTKIEGRWTNADGTRIFPFEAPQFAQTQRLHWEASLSRGAFEGDIAYPMFDSPLDKASSRIREDLSRRYAEFDKQMREMLNDLPEGIEARTYTFDATDYTVEFHFGELVSVVYQIFVDGGGAHPNRFFVAYNLTPGGSVSLADLFKPGAPYAEELSKRLIDDLRRQEAQWVVDGQLTGLKPEEFPPFAVTPRGLLFLFDPYVAGPYAQGEFTVEIPYEAVQGMLKDDTPLATFLEPTQ